MHNPTWNMIPTSVLALGPRDNKENLDRVGGSQELPDV
jgi:hypothetical protein